MNPVNREFDCRHFRGDKPCAYCGGRRCGPLTGEKAGCGRYEPIQHRTLIIKLGALGDVVRTTTLLPALHRKYPGTTISWVTQPGAIPLVQNELVWKTLPWNLDTVLWAETATWDLVICLDKEEGPTSLATRVRAVVRHGYGRNADGLLMPLSPSSEHLFLLGIDDDMKFRRNTLSYPRLIADACGLEWAPNPYVLQLSQAECAWADTAAVLFAGGNGVGLHLGSGEGFAGKCWPPERFVELAKMLLDAGAVPVFLGGRREAALYEEVRTMAPAGSVFPGCEFSLREFAALTSKLRVMVSGDSLAMHIAIGTHVHSVALFGSTIEREIEYYGRGESLTGRVPCSPCFKRVCPTYEECMREIAVSSVFDAVQRGLKKKG